MYVTGQSGVIKNTEHSDTTISATETLIRLEFIQNDAKKNKSLVRGVDALRWKTRMIGDSTLRRMSAKRHFGLTQMRLYRQGRRSREPQEKIIT